MYNPAAIMESPNLWDDLDYLDKSGRSSPVMFEEQFSFPTAQASVSAGNSPLDYPLSPEGSSSRLIKKLIGRSSLDIDNTARDHYLYHNVTPQADGLYHCPWEKDPNSNCQHKPQKLKCNYEYKLYSFSLILS
jgi:hypothetical protein